MQKNFPVRLGSDLYIACGRLADRFNKDRATAPAKVVKNDGPWSVGEIAEFIVRQYFDPCTTCAAAAKFHKAQLNVKLLPIHEEG